MVRITIEQIKEELQAHGWDLVSTEYKNLDSELVFKCDKGHEVYSTWKKIRTARECPVCNQDFFKNTEAAVIPKKKNEYRVLALDQATHTSGWALFSDGHLLKYGVYNTLEDSEIARDFQVKNWLINMVNNWKVDFVGLEGIQYDQYAGVTTFATLARLQGILMETLYEMKIEYVVCPTNTWRKYCDVKGRTRSDKKHSMQLRVKDLYGVSVTDDCADAIGIGRYTLTKSKKPKIESWE